MANTTHERLIAAILTLAKVQALGPSHPDALEMDIRDKVGYIFKNELDYQLEITRRDRHE